MTLSSFVFNQLIVFSFKLVSSMKLLVALQLLIIFNKVFKVCKLASVFNNLNNKRQIGRALCRERV